MPTLPQLTYSWDSPAAAVSRVRLVGNLVNENADLLLAAILEDLSGHPAARELHVDCADVGLCDSRGLSVLLMLRRRTDSLGIALHVANRGQALAHLLERTGTAEYLVPAHCAAVPDEETSG
ncbi:STAS domain-containing protein [Actinophytocola sp.]|uniref:STAS domain-containing protein n=1 Tax=Actinophytocola sp. TaxID=1872138 RepID=UPI002D5F0870|nr:STAS domain-containing protein [Actinophytocola sp.]HYQ67647.1 STAS domain-containing protein [Actinophytocola sp.]